MIEWQKKGGLEIKTLTVRLDDELHRQFKIYAVNQNKDMQAILIDYIKSLLPQNDSASQ